MTLTQLERKAKQDAYNRLIAQGMSKTAARKFTKELYDEAIEEAKKRQAFAQSLKVKSISGQRAINILINALVKQSRKAWEEERKPYFKIFKEHIRDLKKRGYTFDFHDVELMTLRELKYYSSTLTEFTKKYGRPPSDTIPDLVTKTKTLSRRESWEKYKRDIEAYNKQAEKYHANKFREFDKSEGGEYFVSNWEKFSKRPRIALRNLPEKNWRMLQNFVKVYDAMGAAGNEEAEYIARMLRQFYVNDEVTFIQLLNDAAKGKNALEYVHMFASTTQEKDNALQSFTEIYELFGSDKYGELAIKPYSSRTIED